jgi:hypothetical protein
VLRSENVYDEINYLAATRRSPDEEVVISHVPRGFPLQPGRGEIDSVLFGSDRIVIASKLAAGSALVISDVFYPGWQAWAAGKRFPVQRGNKVLRTVLLPAGDYSGASSLYLLYRPVSWRLGLYVTLLFCLGLSGYALLRARTPAADQQSASAGEKDLRA